MQALYRATSIDALELIATRTTEEPRQASSGGIHPLQDGAAAWWTGPGFEIVEPDGSVRWTHPTGSGVASDADTMLVVSRIPTGVGDGTALRLEKLALPDGTPLWSREHRRFVVTDPSTCGDHDCSLIDSTYPVLRPDGGYLLVGRHAYPSSTCTGQPLLMAVSADGDVEWAHRIDTCGQAHRVAFREYAVDRTRMDGWLRWIEL